MVFIALGDYIKAQQYLDNAYGIAKARENYTLESIDTQQARLFILKAIEVGEIESSIELFTKGHNLLISVKNLRYKYRQLYLYNSYFKEKIIYLKNHHAKKIFLDLGHKMLESLNTDLTSKGSTISYQKENAINELSHIIDNLARLRVTEF